MANSGLIFFVAIQFFNAVVAPQTNLSEDESCSKRPFYLRWMKEHPPKPELYKKLEKVVKGKLSLDALEKDNDGIRLSDENFLRGLVEFGPALFEAMSQNYVENVLKDQNELKKLRAKQLEEMEKEDKNCPIGEKMPNEESKMANSPIVEQKQIDKEINEISMDSEKVANSAAEMMANLSAEANIGENEEEREIKQVEDDPQNIKLAKKELDLERWKADELVKLGIGKIFGWLTNLNQKRKASNLKTTIKYEMKVRVRKEWKFYEWKQFKANWKAKWWTAIPKWFGYYLNPWHCIGLNDMVKAFKQMFDPKEKKEIHDYKQKGRQIFDMFCYLNGNVPEQVELHEKDHTLHIKEIIKLPDGDTQKNMELDKYLDTLSQFTLGALLIPFRQKAIEKNANEEVEGQHEKKMGISKEVKDGIKNEGKDERKKGHFNNFNLFRWFSNKKKNKKGSQKEENTVEWQLDNVDFEELVRLKAVLTEKKLLDAILIRMQQKFGEENAPKRGHQHRGKRAFSPTMTFAGISFSAHTIAIGIGGLVGFVLLDLAVVWCMDWLSLPLI